MRQMCVCTRQLAGFRIPGLQCYAVLCSIGPSSSRPPLPSIALALSTRILCWTRPGTCGKRSTRACCNNPWSVPWTLPRPSGQFIPPACLQVEASRFRLPLLSQGWCALSCRRAYRSSPGPPMVQDPRPVACMYSASLSGAPQGGVSLSTISPCEE